MPDPIALIRSAAVVVAWDATGKHPRLCLGRRCGISGQSGDFRRAPVRWNRGRNDRRPRADGDAGPREHPRAPLQRADEQRPDR
jgi:hypothetical protein